MIKKLVLTVSFIGLLTTALSGTAYAAEKKKCFSLKVSERSLAECFSPLIGDSETRERKKMEKKAAREAAKAEAAAKKAEKAAERERRIKEKKDALKRQREERKAATEERKRLKAEKKAARKAAKAKGEILSLEQKIESCKEDPKSAGCKKDQLKYYLKKLKNLGGENIGEPG